MVLTNEFTVAADPDTVWRHLLDMEGVASCLPGATIESTDEENTYNGSMRLRIGPMTVDYKGTATLTEVDEASRTARISLRASEARGQGTAMATISNRVTEAEEGTRVVAETDLHVTGPQAQFGRGVMQDVGNRVLTEFSNRLEQQIAGTGPEPGAAVGPAANGSQPGASGKNGAGAASGAGEEDGEALDLGSILYRSAMARYAKIAVALVAVLTVAILIRRR